MQKLRFSILIHAPATIVYNKMISKKSYQEWTSVFNPSSQFKGSWKKGSKILFIGIDKKGNTSGIVSRIRKNIPGKFISIEHIGILQGNKENTSGSEIEKWAGAMENYSFIKQNGSTLLEVEMDSADEFKFYFQKTWPKALDKLKKLCES